MSNQSNNNQYQGNAAGINGGINSRSGRVALNKGVQEIFSLMTDIDEAAKEEMLKSFKAAKALANFKRAIEYIYKDAAPLILQKINAVYIMKKRDKGNKLFESKNDPLITTMVIYTNDSMVHSDLDSKQEFIKMWFNNNAQRIDQIQFLSSKLGMRKRFPYVTNKPQSKSIQDNIQNIEIDYSQLPDVSKSLTQEQKELINSKINQLENEELKNILSRLTRQDIKNG